MRRCLFCDNDSSPMTREHAIPDWLLNTLGVRDAEEPLVEAWRGEGTAPRVHGGVAVKVRQVCEACNHGWMSELETQAKRIIGPLVADLAIALDREAQALLSRWTIKTAVVLEATGPRPPCLRCVRQAPSWV